MQRDFILIADDFDHAAMFTEWALRDAGYTGEIVRVQTGEAALHFLFGEGRYAKRDISQKPGLVILDYKIRGLTGLEVLGQMKADLRTRDIPTVVFSSGSEEDLQERTLALGAAAYVRKPVVYEDFEREVRVFFRNCS